jgi:beta-phosphoglucomutase-like phosphatase (HAD superfamily)/choline kinase
MNIIIPLGGKGERFKKEGYSLPKPLIKVLEKEILFYVIDNLDIHDEDKVFIIYNNELDLYNFKELILKKYPFINLIRLDKETKGAAETIYIGLDIIINNFEYNKKTILVDGDAFYTENILELFRNINNNAIYYTYNYDISPIFSYIILDNNNFVSEIKEKQKISNNANTGAYAFNNILSLYEYSKYIIDNNITFKNEPYISCIIDHMINKNEFFEGILLNEEFVFVLGTPNQVKIFENKIHIFNFDLDGTLIISDDIYFSIWYEILKKYNIYLTLEIFNTYIQGNTDEFVLKKILPNMNIDILEVSNMKDNFFINNLDKLKIVDGTIDFLKEIRRYAHKIVIVTNCNRLTAERILEETRINRYIDGLIIGSECDRAKPFPDPYINACKMYNISNKKSFIFEDSKTGILSGRNTNPKCLIGIETLYDYNTLYKLGANITIQNYKNINLLSLLNYNPNLYDSLKYYIKKSLKYDIKDIEIYDEKLKGGYISDVIKVNIILKNNEILESVLKLENKNETKLSIMANKLGLYEREYYFYDSISKYIDSNIKIPTFYGLIKDDNFNNIGILMENINKDNFKLNLNLNKININITLKIIEKISILHSQFWNKDLSNIFPNLLKNNNERFNPIWTDYITNNWEYFKNKWSNILTNKQLLIGEKIVSNFSLIQSKLSDKNLTLCHGDVKSPNIFYEEINNNEYIPYFIDWQYISNGKGIQDIVFLIIESFDIEKIILYTPIIKNYYYCKLLENNIKDYTLKDYENDFINSICYYPFFVAIWFGITPEEDLIDKNFPFFFIQKLFNFIELYVPENFFDIN